MSIKKRSLRGVFARRARMLMRSCQGNIAPMAALLIVPLVGVLGMATEGGSWFAIQRAEQNAADAAVIAAATNGGNGGTDYATEGQSIASGYGFVNGTNNTTVTVPAPTTYASVTSCVSSSCYAVQITHKVGLYLLPVLGFKGNTTIGTSPAQSITSTALATTKTVPGPFCLTVLGSGGITAHGVPKSTIGCNIQSAGDADCTGHDLTSGYSDAEGSKNSCGGHQNTVNSINDPYSSLASRIPASSADGCSNTYYMDSDPKWTATVGTSQTLNVNTTLPAVKYSCGDYLVPPAGGTITTPAGGSVLVIENGQLDLQGTLTVAAGSGLTIIFTSPAGTNDQYTECVGKKCSTQVSNDPNGPGTLDLSSPTSGPWSGMAMYQDPSLPEESLDYAGNSPTWNISGVIYLPKTDFTASGAVSKSTNGDSCFTLVVNSFLINGTGDLFYVNDQSQCAQQGVTSPTNVTYVTGELVY